MNGGKALPSILRKFLNAPDRRKWFVFYLAHKLGVTFETSTEDKQEANASDTGKSEAQSEIISQKAHEDRFVALSDLVVSRGANGGSWVTHRSDTIIGARLRRDGQFQEYAIDDCLALLNELGVRNGRETFVDIGANIGTHSLHAARLGFQRVLSLEPNPTNFMLLQANVVLNNLSDQVRCRNIAASSETGTLLMELSPDNYGDHRVALDADKAAPLHGEGEWSTTQVIVQTLDDVLTEESISPDDLSLVWVDTQGHEGHVLAGAKKLALSDCPVVIEFWPYGLARSDGFELLKETLRSYQSIIDLSEVSAGSPKKLRLQDLDRMFAEMLSVESEHASPHTDLLLLR